MSSTFQAMVLTKPKEPLTLQNLPFPNLKKGEVLVKVHACGVCRTDLHIFEGELSNPKLPLVLGHEIVGVVEEIGPDTPPSLKNQKVGIPWLHSTCHSCPFCKSGRENLCDRALFTGYQINGGFAEYTVCPQEALIPLKTSLTDEEISPLLCAGLIGYRAYRKANPEKTLGLYGFGAAAHLLAQLAIQEGKEVYAFTKSNDQKGQAFAKKLGCKWAQGSDKKPPILLDALIHFAPVGELVPPSLKILKKGGRCILAGIHMSDIPTFPYSDIWGEKRIESVANLTREDGELFFEKIRNLDIRPQITTYPLKKANEALLALKEGTVEGALVLKMG